LNARGAGNADWTGWASYALNARGARNADRAGQTLNTC
jgi:hypothetical protein